MLWTWEVQIVGEKADQKSFTLKGKVDDRDGVFNYSSLKGRVMFMLMFYWRENRLPYPPFNVFIQKLEVSND